MTYTELKNEIEDIALGIKNIGHFSDNDIYEEWNKPNIEYSAVNIYLNQVSKLDNGIQFILTFYYADRLLNDKSNRNSIWQNGYNTILTILNKLDDDLTYDIPLNFTTFEQTFADNLAGVYTQVTINSEYEIGKCGL